MKNSIGCLRGMLAFVNTITKEEKNFARDMEHKERAMIEFTENENNILTNISSKVNAWYFNY
ncbi:hypothetical protein WGM54_14110 [Paenibacillus polymyxa]|uniref:hypothetical protein n=1 Tax=Paenibacillus polymyxa TaxID=1406 RepID=UPI00307ECE06